MRNNGRQYWVSAVHMNFMMWDEYVWANQSVQNLNWFLCIGRFSEAGLHELMPFVIFRARSRERSQRHFRADF